MSLKPIKLGSVYQTEWDDDPIRILAVDEVEVLYDAWWDHVPGWGLSKLRGSATYYRLPTSLLRKKAKLLRMEPLSPEEVAFHRPDLPLRVGRHEQLQWTKQKYATMKAFAAALKRTAPRDPVSDREIVLTLPVVALIPFGPQGSPKRSVAVTAANGHGFTELELLWQAHNLQAPLLKEWDAGVGLYRSGFERGIPSYYLWGFYDKAGYLEPPTKIVPRQRAK